MHDMQVIREIASGAQIHPEAHVGRWCVIGPDVHVGAGTVLADRVTVTGRTHIGRDNRVGSGSVLGAEPQDLKYRGGGTWLLIGDRNRIGHNVTAHVGTEVGGWVTFVGDDNVLDDTCHVAHDCYVSSRTHIGRGVLLAGHIVVQEGAAVEAMTGVEAFARIGRFSRIGPRTPVRRDVPPFADYYSTDYYWDPPSIRGLHEAGIVAAALPKDQEQRLRDALGWLFDRDAAMATKLDLLERGDPDPHLAYVCQFCRESLSGLYGRYRSLFRGQLPPEARQYLPTWLLETIEKEMQCL